MSEERQNPQAANVAAKNDANQNGTRSNALGLDIGTSRIVAATSSDPREARTELNAFVAVPSSEMA